MIDRPCVECGQPMLPRGRKREHPDDFRHARGCPRAVTCAQLGESLWGRRDSGGGTCPWARPVGKIVRSLRLLGLARRLPARGAVIYELTTTGRHSAMAFESIVRVHASREVGR